MHDQVGPNQDAVGAPEHDVPAQHMPGPYPARVVAWGMGLVVAIGIVMFGIADLLQNRQGGGLDVPSAVRHAATALIVGGVIATIFELVIHRQASAAMHQVMHSTFGPVADALIQQTKVLDESISKAQEAIQVSHVMAVAQHVGLVDIFRDRRELFDKELRERLTAPDVKAVRMLGVSLRDVFAGDGPLYETFARLYSEIESGQSQVELEATVMRGDCQDADLRIEVEEGAEFMQQQKTTGKRGNWRAKSRLWGDYKRVTDSWELHFTQVTLCEFDHLPTAWVMLIESRNPEDSAVYVEQYHYGRIGITRHGYGHLYSCLGGKVPVLKFRPGTTYEIFRNHLQVMRSYSKPLCLGTGETPAVDSGGSP